ncbi:hypothetical protein [Terribacillus saccharophilus]|uniref:hypothetical protein n=1 Tax=Terribacillus saccharophilus TaxID=361277 RepID=UPI003D28B2EF
MEDFLKDLRMIVENEGVNTTLKNLSISALYYENAIYGLFFSEPINEDLSNVIWLRFEEKVFYEYFKDEKYKELINKLKNKKAIYLSENGSFFGDFSIEGISSKFSINPQDNEVLDVIGVEVKKITNVSKYDLNKGIIGIITEGEGENFYQLSEKMKGRISQALLPYINEPCFAYLKRQMIVQFSEDADRELLLIECQGCKKHDIYHIYEVVNAICHPDYCRSCVEPKYSSVSKVPFSTAFQVNVYGYFNDLFLNYIHKGIKPNEKLLKEILPYTSLEHPLERGVVFDYVRTHLKMKFEKESYELLETLEQIMDDAKKRNQREYNKLITNLEKLSSLQSLQSTSDIVDTYNDIEEKSKNSFIKMFYPHPLIKNDDEHIHSDKSIVHANLTNIANLYKDIFDLVSDHRFIANLGRILNRQNISENCITEDLFGANLLQETRKNVRHTKLNKIIKDVYDSRLRNSIAHPGRYIDRHNNEVKIFNKGSIVNTMPMNDFIAKIEKLINFHNALKDVKYRATFEADKEFLSTGGIISFEVDFFTAPEDVERPHIIINQLQPFKKFSTSIDWWKDVININAVIGDEGNGLSISVKRKPSILGDSPTSKENIYGISDHVREWIEMVIEQKEVMVTHRYIHIPIDISEKEEQFEWIPVSVPVYYLEEEHEYFIQYMASSGVLRVSEELSRQLEELIK